MNTPKKKISILTILVPILIVIGGVAAWFILSDILSDKISIEDVKVNVREVGGVGGSYWVLADVVVYVRNNGFTDVTVVEAYVVTQQGSFVAINTSVNVVIPPGRVRAIEILGVKLDPCWTIHYDGIHITSYGYDVEVVTARGARDKKAFICPYKSTPSS